MFVCRPAEEPGYDVGVIVSLSLIGLCFFLSGATALLKIRAGASLVQLYSGLVFRGLGLIADIKTALVEAMERDRKSALTDYIGADAATRIGERAT